MTIGIRSYDRRYAKLRHGDIIIRGATHGPWADGIRVAFEPPATVSIERETVVQWDGTYVVTDPTKEVALQVVVSNGKCTVLSNGMEMERGPVGHLFRVPGLIFSVTPEMPDGRHALVMTRGSRIVFESKTIAALNQTLHTAGAVIRVVSAGPDTRAFAGSLSGGSLPPSGPVHPLPMYHLNYDESGDCEPIEVNRIYRWDGSAYVAQ